MYNKACKSYGDTTNCVHYTVVLLQSHRGPVVNLISNCLWRILSLPRLQYVAPVTQSKTGTSLVLGVKLLKIVVPCSVQYEVVPHISLSLSPPDQTYSPMSGVGMWSWDMENLALCSRPTLCCQNMLVSAVSVV